MSGSASASNTFFRPKGELAATTATTLRQSTFVLFNSENASRPRASATSICPRRKPSTRSASTVTMTPLCTKEQKNVSYIFTHHGLRLTSIFVSIFAFHAVRKYPKPDPRQPPATNSGRFVAPTSSFPSQHVASKPFNQTSAGAGGMCKNTGCKRPCYKESDGRVHDFCGLTCRNAYRQRGGE